jgi:organic hydroperoxide reductase OsmC/OhrA
MTAHSAVVEWDRTGEEFLDRRYRRAHRWTFDGGACVAASSSPAVVPPPYSDPAGVDPEEGYVAALASCHMLWFLDITAGRGYCVDHYRDEAVGTMEKNEAGKTWVGRVQLRPHAVFSGPRQPVLEDVEQMHQAAHEECFLANSVRSTIEIRPSFAVAGDR